MIKRRTTLYGLSLFATAIATQPYRLVVVDGPSMTPTYQSGTLLVGSRLIGNLRKGDVVVVRRDDGELIKRVAYVGGDRFTQYELAGTWFEPGTPSAEHSCIVGRYPSRVVTIPEDSIYVLGDNDSESFDSRRFGPVPLTDVIMRVPRPKPKEAPKFGVDGYSPRVVDASVYPRSRG